MSTTEQTPANTEQQTQTQTQQQTPKTYTQEEYDAVSSRLTEANREAAANRVKAKELTDQLKGFEGTAEEKAKLQTKLDELSNSLTATQERAVNAEIKFLAKKHGAADPDDVVKLIDRSKLEVKDGDPVNAEKLVEELLKAKPHLKGATGSVDAGAKGGTATSMNDLLRRATGRG
jgi:predicted  nucleic acid-binding Zn-ribbon protein